MNRSRVVALLGLLPIVAAIVAHAAEIAGVRFSDRLTVAETPIRLNGVGLFRYAIVFKVYVGALYLGPGVPPERVLEDVPKRLEVQYLRSFRGQEFGEAGDQVLARNVPPEVLGRLRTRLDRMNAFYEDVQPGDRSALTYIPGRGTELSINGRSKGWIQGADFAAAYFCIWFGEKPLSDSFKSQLLEPVKESSDERPSA